MSLKSGQDWEQWIESRERLLDLQKLKEELESTKNLLAQSKREADNLKREKSEWRAGGLALLDVKKALEAKTRLLESELEAKNEKFKKIEQIVEKVEKFKKYQFAYLIFSFMIGFSVFTLIYSMKLM